MWMSKETRDAEALENRAGKDFSNGCCLGWELRGQKGASHMGIWAENFPGKVEQAWSLRRERAACVEEGARWPVSKEREPQEARGSGHSILNLTAQDEGLDRRVWEGRCPGHSNPTSNTFVFSVSSPLWASSPGVICLVFMSCLLISQTWLWGTFPIQLGPTSKAKMILWKNQTRINPKFFFQPLIPNKPWHGPALRDVTTKQVAPAFREYAF